MHKRVSSPSMIMGIYNRLFNAFGPQHWWPGETPFEVAVGAILTQNTNWGNVEKAIDNLKRAKALSARCIHGMTAGQLSAIIRPAGYYNIKAKRLKAFVDFLMNDYGGSLRKMKGEDTNSLRAKLLGIYGIGPETADSMLLYALGRPVFVIDAYTKRVLSRHGVLKYEEPYEKYRSYFENSLVSDAGLFNEYHALFVMTGKTYCKKTPACDKCPLKDAGEGRVI